MRNDKMLNSNSVTAKPRVSLPTTAAQAWVEALAAVADSVCIPSLT
jgi:hypothetical protein